MHSASLSVQEMKEQMRPTQIARPHPLDYAQSAGSSLFFTRLVVKQARPVSANHFCSERDTPNKKAHNHQFACQSGLVSTSARRTSLAASRRTGNCDHMTSPHAQTQPYSASWLLLSVC
jgi:hypothetical protein